MSGPVFTVAQLEEHLSTAVAKVNEYAPLVDQTNADISKEQAKDNPNQGTIRDLNEDLRHFKHELRKAQKERDTAKERLESAKEAEKSRPSRR